MLENPQLRWAFIRKVYVIISIQLILTVAVTATVVFYRPIPRFVVETTPGLIVQIAVIVLTLIGTYEYAHLYIVQFCSFYYIFVDFI